MYTLPDDASGRSRELLALAQELAARCPASLATEIAVSGSVARGVADQYSDLESTSGQSACQTWRSVAYGYTRLLTATWNWM